MSLRVRRQAAEEKTKPELFGNMMIRRGENRAQLIRLIWRVLSFFVTEARRGQDWETQDSPGAVAVDPSNRPLQLTPVCAGHCWSLLDASPVCRRDQNKYG